MKTVTLIMPLEATTVSDSRSDSSSDTVTTAGAIASATEQHLFYVLRERATIFYAFDIKIVSSAVTIGAIVVATAVSLIY